MLGEVWPQEHPPSSIIEFYSDEYSSECNSVILVAISEGEQTLTGVDVYVHYGKLM